MDGGGLTSESPLSLWLIQKTVVTYSMIIQTLYNHSKIIKIHEIDRVFQDIPVMPPHQFLLSDAHILKKEVLMWLDGLVTMR